MLMLLTILMLGMLEEKLSTGINQMQREVPAGVLIQITRAAF